MLVICFFAGCVGSDSVRDDTPFQADRKVALVIGNSLYQFATALPNPQNDARRLAEALRNTGFSVVEGIDLDAAGMKRAMTRFAAGLENASVALFFFAGHGIQISGRNYLIPVDTDFSVNFAGRHGAMEKQAVSLDQVLALMDAKPSVNLVFLDACRDNPLVAELLPSHKGATRSVARFNERGIKVSEIYLARGLAQVEARFSRNMFIAYATQPGNVALDGTGVHSPFTEALLAHIQTPNLEVRGLLTEVRKTVMAATGNKQIPWDHASLTEKFYFKPAAKTAPPPP